MVTKTTRRKKTNETVIKDLVKSLKEYDDIEEAGLYAKADTIADPLEVDRIIKRYKEIIKTQNKRAINYAGKLEQLLKKLKRTDQRFENVGQSSPQYILTFNYFQKNFIVMCKK